jgi:hypothetical protein
MKKTIIILLTFIFLCGANINAADRHHSKITLDQARALVWTVLTPEALRFQDIQILAADKDPENISSYKDSNHPRFLFFTVVWNGPPDGVWYYSVDIYTGDVFNGTASCAEYYNKKLNVLQKKVRYSLHLTQAAYRKIKTKGPMCDD